MFTCTICFDRLKSPVALPCGHVYCHECILHTIHGVTPLTTQHLCPTCRSPYSTVNIDPTFVPHHLRPYLTTSVRKLYLEDQPLQPPQMTSKIMSDSGSSDSEISRLIAENMSLRANCIKWQRRSEVQAAATLGLIGLTRFARDRALELKQQRDELQQQYDALKRKLDDLQAFSIGLSENVQSPSPSDSAVSSNQPAKRSQSPNGTSLFSSVSPLDQTPGAASSPLGIALLALPQCTDTYASGSGVDEPGTKRRRKDSPSSCSTFKTSSPRPLRRSLRNLSKS